MSGIEEGASTMTISTMSIPTVRRSALSAAMVVLLLAFPGSVGATITGGCTGEGHSTSSGANLTTDAVWHLKSSDIVGGSGTAPAPMRSATVSAYGLGIGIPIAGGLSQDGETSGSVDDVTVSTYAIFGRRFVVAGSASGDAQCSGEIEIVLDDVNPLLTAFGGGGIILAIIGLIALALLAGRESNLGNRFLGGVLGALGGLGAALALEQFGFLDPTQPIGLFMVIGLAIVGFVTAGLFRRGGTRPMAPA
jgi:hypothetical protein